MKAVEVALAQAKENLEHARKEIDLLRRIRNSRPNRTIQILSHDPAETSHQTL